MAASIPSIALRAPILPLAMDFKYEDVDTVKIEHTHRAQVQGAEVERTRKAKLPVVNDIESKERLLYVIDSFNNACVNSRLHIGVGTDKYEKFNEVLGGDLRLQWSILSTARANKTNDTFTEDIQAFLRLYMDGTAYHDQKEYIRNSTKPFKLTCLELATRLRVISNLGKLLPGSNGAELFADDAEMKRAYYGMMLDSWKVKFAENGHDFTNVNYSLNDLVRFMTIQEQVANARKATGKRKDDGSRDSSRGDRNRNSRRGRGRHHGGRFSEGRSHHSGGRGSYGGRGYGDNRQGNNNSYGRYPTTPRTPYQGQYGNNTQAGRAVTRTPTGNSGRYQRPMVSPRGGRGGAGRAPYVPTFATDNHGRRFALPPPPPSGYAPPAAPPAQDQFWAADAYEEHGDYDQFFGQDEQQYQEEYYPQESADYDYPTDPQDSYFGHNDDYPQEEQQQDDGEYWDQQDTYDY